MLRTALRIALGLWGALLAVGGLGSAWLAADSWRDYAFALLWLAVGGVDLLLATAKDLPPSAQQRRAGALGLVRANAVAIAAFVYVFDKFFLIVRGTPSAP